MNLRHLNQNKQKRPPACSDRLSPSRLFHFTEFCQPLFEAED